MDDAAPLSPEELQGFAVIAEACAEAFLNEPSAQIVDDVARVARALGDGRLDGVVADEALRQRYSERFFVPTGPLYVPLSECSVRGAAEEEGRVRYAPVSGAQADHVLKCYRAVGFDWRRRPLRPHGRFGRGCGGVDRGIMVLCAAAGRRC